MPPNSAFDHQSWLCRDLHAAPPHRVVTERLAEATHVLAALSLTRVASCIEAQQEARSRRGTFPHRRGVPQAQSYHDAMTDAARHDFFVTCAHVIPVAIITNDGGRRCFGGPFEQPARLVPASKETMGRLMMTFVGLAE